MFSKIKPISPISFYSTLEQVSVEISRYLEYEIRIPQNMNANEISNNIVNFLKHTTCVDPRVFVNIITNMDDVTLGISINGCWNISPNEYSSVIKKYFIKPPQNLKYKFETIDKKIVYRFDILKNEDESKD